MEFSEYQFEAKKTDQNPGDDIKGLTVPLLGLAGEAGTLVSEFKKYLRDGPSHQLFDERVAEELGDALWYIANIASKRQLSLNDIAEMNLNKSRARWRSENAESQLLLTSHQHLYDSDFPEREQIPRAATFEFRQEERDDGTNVIIVEWEGETVGSPLTDNSFYPDGYRFHDAFHLAYAAILGWSPILRAITDRKRRSDPRIDEVEDGGRAKVIEEGIAALVFAYARDHRYLEDVDQVDYSLLRTIRAMTVFLEVRDRTESEWQKAILAGFDTWRSLVKHHGGHVSIDLSSQSIHFSTSGT